MRNQDKMAERLIDDVVKKEFKWGAKFEGLKDQYRRKLFAGQIIRDVVNTLKEHYHEHDVKIHLEMPENPAVVVIHKEIYQEYLIDVLFDIIQNAIESLIQARTIKIVVSVANEFLNIEVYDQNSGIHTTLTLKQCINFC